MSKIIIAGTTTYVAEAATVSLLNGGFVADTAKISYNFLKGLPLIEDTEHYPLILEGRLANSKTSIHVYAVTAGYGGTGPNTLIEILKAAGFDFEENHILTKCLADSTGLIEFTLKK